MKKCKNILKYLIPVWVLAGNSFCQDLDIDLILLNTGQFTLTNWSNVEDLWSVRIVNDGQAANETINYYLQFKLIQDNDIKVEGHTKPLSIGPGDEITYKNLDPIFNQNILAFYDENSDFISEIEDLGYLPSGDYTLELTAKAFGEVLGSDKEEIKFILGDHFSIEYPDDKQVIAGANELYFQWDTPGFREGVQIEFRLIIAAIVPGESDNPGGAIDYGEANSVYYFDSKWESFFEGVYSWPWIETGTSLPLNIFYTNLLSDPNFKEFVCGYEYAWRMEAREIIDGYNDGGNQGIWGWPEPEKSVIRKFTWGESPTGLESPSGDDVLPTFRWNDIWCAESEYDIQISLSDDTEFNERLEYTDDIDFQYPSDAPGLIPGESYIWRVRAFSFTGETPWSNTATFKIDEIELIEPALGAVLESVRPSFNIKAPANIGHYELMISYKNDVNVTLPEVYNTEEQITNVPWQYPSQGNEVGLFPGMIYYWKMLMFDKSGNILGEGDDYKVWNFRIIPIILSEPTNGATNVSLNPKFEWEPPTSVPKYEFWLSNDQDPGVENPPVIIDVLGAQFLEYPNDAEITLNYEKTYYWRVVPKDLNNNYPIYEPSSSYSDVSQFTGLEFPELGEELSTSNSDMRIPIINITVLDGLEYTIFIYGDSEGSSIIEEISGITSFPYVYSDGKEKLQYGTTYYIQVQPMKDGEPFGNSSNILVFSIPEEPENTEQCEISCELTDSDEPEILTTILTGLEDATEYLILISQNEDMSNPIEISISAGESQYLLTSEHVNWGQTYYTQAVALSSDGEILGLASDIQMINVESKPGMNEQTAINVSLPEGSTTPKFEIINEISGATGYRIIISTESDMSVEMMQFDILSSLTADYPNDGPPLQYGKSYYVTAQGLDADNAHGIISSVVAFFIPNITPPILGQPFGWEASIPSADHYLLEVSLVEDFSAMVISKPVQGTSSPLNMDELDYSKSYYWRVQGQDSDGELFGNPSQISFFETEPIPTPELNLHSEEVSLTPEFTWTGIEMVIGYQITVASDGGMENIIWQENIGGTSAVYPESASQLEFAGTYYWQVSAMGENDNLLSFSTIGLFNTKSVYPVIGLNPDGGTETMTPLFQWEANDKITSYMLNVGSDTEMSTIIVSEQVDGNSKQIDEGVLLAGLSYYWIVDGLDENGESLAGPSNHALIVMPSTENIPLISPVENVEVDNLNPVLKWGALLGTSSYAIRVSKDPGFESIIIEEIISSTEFIIPESNRLENSTAYFWQAEGATEDKIVISSPGNFKTPASAAITILKLDDGESVSVSNPVFSWEGEEGIAAFSIRFSDKADFSGSWNFQFGATDFEYPGEPSLNFNTPYYWQVSPLNNEGNPIGGWTTPRNFSISAAFIVELELPGNGETATTSKPTFQWGVIEGVTKFEIQVSSIEDFSEILWTSAEIVENSTTYPGSGAEQLSYGQAYFWRVRALGESAPLGDFSSPFSFDLSGENKVGLEGPLAEESETLFPYFSWISVNGASGYTLTLASDETISTIIYSTEATEVFIQYPQGAPPLNNGITYYWNVIAKDENSSPIGDISNTGSFSTPAGTIEVEFMFGTE